MKTMRAVATLWLAAFGLTAALTAQAQRDLPDFTRVVEDQGNAVVNISTTQAVRRAGGGAMPQVPGMEDEEVLEFFRRFIPRQPGPGQPGPGPGPRSESRSLGSPFGFENTVTAGIVSAKGRSLPQENFVPFIQTDVAINPGNSGGPLFNMRGEVVGINSQIYSRTGGFMGLSFAIPADVALDVQKQLKEKGRVARGRIGVVIQEVTRDLATSFGLDKPRGALVNSVEKGSPADKAGVEATDIILSFDGKTVDASSDLPRIVGSTRPGSTSTVEVWRKGAAKKLSLTVGELQEDRVASADKPRPQKPAEAQPANRLGIVVAELSAEQKKEMKIPGGLVVTEVKPEARASDVRKGDVLLTLVHKGQHTELKSVDQFNKLLAGLEKNAVITLQVKRGETMAFVTISGLTDKG